MSTISETSRLRSAFLKVGWAPVVTIGGTILFITIALIFGVNTVNEHSDFGGVAKIIMAGCTASALAGHIISWSGFSQAHSVSGMTKAGDAFATLRIIFLIYAIISAIFMVMTLLLPTSPQTYIDMAENAEVNIRKWATLGIVFVVSYSIIAVYSIISLFLIMNKTATIASTLNVESLDSAAKGARYAVYCFFAAIAVGIIAAATTEPAIAGLCELALMAFAIFSLVKWIGGWLGAATEVMRHPVEAQDYTVATE